MEPTRITSTYVEKTCSICCSSASCEDHLHIRGENLSFLVLTLCPLGSPPHTWRKQDFQSWINLEDGITSTYVEKTHSKLALSSRLQDHLHIRGENELLVDYLIDYSGSPPHTWRKPKNYVVSGVFARITSTYVEKT